MAYDRTVTNIGALKWKYMDSIIQSWNAKGLRTRSEIERLDRRGGETARTSADAGKSPAQSDRARMEKMIEKLRKK